ncbi:MAG: hypothetical protein ACYDA8_00825 [Deferrisomatales bacterium]
MILATAVLAAAGVAFLATAGYYRLAVVRERDARLEELGETVRELRQGHALLSKQVANARQFQEETAQASAERLHRDRSAGFDITERVRADLEACRQARDGLERALPAMNGELAAARQEVARLRQQVTRAEFSGTLLDRVRELEDQRAALVGERPRKAGALAAVNAVVAEEDRQCVLQGPASPACAEASRLHMEQSSLKADLAFLEERARQLDREIEGYKKRAQ